MSEQKDAKMEEGLLWPDEKNETLSLTKVSEP
jgi:hypothetical protein